LRRIHRPENVFIVAIDSTEPVGYAVAYLLDRIDRDQRMMFFYEICVADPIADEALDAA
jgi:hypothetical protein